MTVIDISKARPQRQDRMRAKVDENGDLELKLPGAPRYAIANDTAIQVLQVLLGQLVRARDRKLGAAPRVEKAAECRPGACNKRRDGGRGPFGGCRRWRDHKGQCRDANGDYTPASCLHLGTGRCKVKIVKQGDADADVFGDTGEVFYTCQHCGEKAPLS